MGTATEVSLIASIRIRQIEAVRSHLNPGISERFIAKPFEALSVPAMSERPFVEILLNLEIGRARSEAVPRLPAIRIEIQNLGRSPAIYVTLRLSLDGILIEIDRSRVLSDGMNAVTTTDIASIAVDGIGPNGSAYVWIANSTATPMVLALTGALQRDPFGKSEKAVRVAAFSTSSFHLAGYTDVVAGEIWGGDVSVKIRDSR